MPPTSKASFLTSDDDAGRRLKFERTDVDYFYNLRFKSTIKATTTEKCVSLEV